MPEDEAREKGEVAAHDEDTRDPEAGSPPSDPKGGSASAEGATEATAENPSKDGDRPKTKSDMPEETRDEKGAVTKPKSKKRRAQSKQGKQRKPPPTEEEIDAPDWRTLILLGVVFLITAASVGSARVACNYHPPENHPPPALPTVKLAKTPKGAAIELAYRWATKNYDLAVELAKGGLLRQIEAEAEQCHKDAAECEKERERLEEDVVASAVLLESGATEADVKVTTIVGGVTSHYRLELTRDGEIWKATARKPEP